MDQRLLSEFPLTLHEAGYPELHAGRPVIPAGAQYPGEYLTACGLTIDPEPVEERIGHPTCPACVAKLYGPTIGGLVDLVTEVNTANGWRGNLGDVLTEHHPLAQIAGLCEIPLALANVIEDIRKPTGNKGTTAQLQNDLAQEAHYRVANGLHGCTVRFLRLVDELHKPVYGSKTQAIARVNLFGTENAELIEAILQDDLPQIEDELADCIIRPLDFAGAWNDAHPDQRIDVQRGVLAKLEKNRTRGYKHGGKTA